MALYELFSHSDRFHYRANLLSLATFFLFLCTILTFLPPFLFVFYAGGFSIDEQNYSEQPRVSYSSKYILTIENNDITTNRFFGSSYGSINTVFRNVYIPTTNTFSAIDNNDDGVIDQFSIILQSFINDDNPSVLIKNINIWLIFEYELRARQHIFMETMTLLNIMPPQPFSLSNNPNVTVVGDLILEQQQPIESSGSETTYNQSIIDLDNLFTTWSLDLNPVLDEYFTRTYYTSYQLGYTRWELGTTSYSNVLTINIIVNVGSQSIRFTPGFLQRFKWGWIQYLSVLLPFIAFFNRIKEFAFRNRFITTLVELPYHRRKS